MPKRWTNSHDASKLFQGTPFTGNYAWPRLLLRGSLGCDQYHRIGADIVDEHVRGCLGAFGLDIQIWDPFLSKGFGESHEFPAIRAQESALATRAQGREGAIQERDKKIPSNHFRGNATLVALFEVGRDLGPPNIWRVADSVGKTGRRQFREQEILIENPRSGACICGPVVKPLFPQKHYQPPTCLLDFSWMQFERNDTCSKRPRGKFYMVPDE